MKVEAYLCMNGRGDEAIAFYQQAVGAEPTLVMRFKDAPEGCAQGPDGKPIDPERVMHANLQVGETMLMISDGSESGPAQFQGVSLSLMVDSLEQARAIFDALAEQGQVLMPLAETFWSPAFGMLQDRFGVSWMVGLEGPVD